MIGGKNGTMRKWSIGNLWGAVLLSAACLPATAEGDLLWEATVNTDGQALAVEVESGNVFTAGYFDLAGTGRDAVTRAYDAATGQFLWEDLFDFAGGFDFAQDVVIEGGMIVAAGLAGADDSCTIGPAGDCDGLVRAYRPASGQLLWSTLTDHQGGTDFVTSVAARGSRVVISGVGGDVNGAWDYLTTGYAAQTGVPVWQDVLDGGDRSLFEAAWDVIFSGNRVYSAGSLAGGGHVDFTVRAYDPLSGDLQWVDREDRDEGFDVALGIDAGNGVVNAVGNLDFNYAVRTYDNSSD